MRVEPTHQGPRNSKECLLTASSQPQPLRLLAIVAHPHDFTHVIGTCGHHVERGDAVSVVSVTGGAKTHNERLYDELRRPLAERDPAIVEQSMAAYAEGKAHEMVAVCELFGITDLRIMPFTDHPFEVTPEAIEALAEVIDIVRPQVLVTHAPYGPPSKGRTLLAPNDHVSTGIAVQEALARVGTPDPASGRSPHKVAAIYYMAIEFAYHDADLIVDITDQAEKRVEAEILFQSQAHTPEFARKRIDIGAGAFGWTAQTGYGEPFIRAAREVARHLTVTEEDLAAAERSHHERSARISQRVSS